MIRCFGWSMLVVLILSTTSSGIQSGDIAGDQETPDIPLLLVISKDTIDALTRDQVEMSVPIDRQVDESRVTGLAEGQGVIRIVLTPSDDTAEFTVLATGDVQASFRATMGPVTGVASTRAEFHSAKRVRFDGTEFSSAPATTSSCNRTSIDQICSKRGGVVGKVVRNIASRVIMRYKQDVDASVQQVTQDMISASFDDAGEDLVGRLNSLAEFDDTVVKFFPDSENWQFQLATTADFLFAGYGPTGAKVPAAFMRRTPEERASLEVWVRTTRVEAALLKVVVEEWDLAHDLLRNLLPEDEANALLEDVRVTSEEGWSVIEVGKPSTD